EQEAFAPEAHHEILQLRRLGRARREEIARDLLMALRLGEMLTKRIGELRRARDVGRLSELRQRLHLDRVRVGEVLDELGVEVVHQLFLAVALPPLRPAAFFCAVVPPCDELDLDELECEFLPPRLDAPGEFAILAARSLDIPLSFSASYCFSFFTFDFLPGIGSSSRRTSHLGDPHGAHDGNACGFGSPAWAMIRRWSRWSSRSTARQHGSPITKRASGRRTSASRRRRRRSAPPTRTHCRTSASARG